MICIICGEKRKGSKEHIIPESMGNKGFTTYSVCEECNNKMGSNVDDYLTNHIITKIIRKDLGLLGKDKKEIKIFPSNYNDVNGNKYLFRNDKLECLSAPQITNEVMRVTAQSEEEALDIATNKLRKMNYSEEEICKIILSSSKKSVISYQPTFEIPADINKGQYLLAGIKIAYEFACEVFGLSYYNDKVGAILRDELYRVSRMEKKSIQDKINYKLIQTYSSVATDASIIINDIIKSYLQETDSLIRHLCIIHDSKDHKLICQVILLCEPIFSYTVLLSEDATKYLSKGNSKIAVVLKNGECQYL